MTSSDTGEGHGFTASAGMFVAAAKRLNRPIFGGPGEALRSWTGSCNCLVASEMSYRVLLNQSSARDLELGEVVELQTDERLLKRLCGCLSCGDSHNYNMVLQ